RAALAATRLESLSSSNFAFARLAERSVFRPPRGSRRDSARIPLSTIGFASVVDERRTSRPQNLDRSRLRVYSDRDMCRVRRRRKALMSRMAPRLAVFLAFALGFSSAHGAAAQDRSAPEPRPATNSLQGSALDISNGAAMFRNRCAGCHGPDAHGYLGP